MRRWLETRVICVMPGMQIMSQCWQWCHETLSEALDLNLRCSLFACDLLNRLHRKTQ